MNEAFEFYRIWIDEVARLRAMRHQHTQFNVSLNLAGAGALGFFVKDPDKWYLMVWICIGMMVVNLSWMATDKWFSHQTGRKFDQLIELETHLAHKFITIDRDHNWRRTNWLDWMMGVEVVLPRLFLLAFIGMAVWAATPHWNGPWLR